VAEITLDMIKSLRERSGAGVMDCKRALTDAGGNEDKAMQLLLEQGIASAGKKADRVTAQGLVESYIHAGGRIGALVEVNCETDFVARTPEFQSLARELAMQVAAMNPLVVNEEELPQGVDGLPSQLVLMLQPYIRDGSRTIRQLVNEAIGKTGENIRIKRFERFELGVD
jgi:elongation factor Ts